MNTFPAQQPWANAYGYQTVADVAVSQRMAFFKKVYGLFGVGFLVVGFFGWLGMELFRQGIIPLSMWMPLMIIEAIAAWFAQTQTKSRKAGLTLMFSYCAITGLTFGPLLLIAAKVGGITGLGAYGLLMQAFLLSVLTFGGLTVYVFVTKSDFSYLGGLLFMLSFCVLGIAIFSWIWPLPVSSTLSICITIGFVLFTSLCVLYTTSQIVHHYGPEHTILAATQLLVCFVSLLWEFLWLLIQLALRE